MATIDSYQVDASDARTIHDKLLRVNLDGGCGLPGCHCSDHPYITVSDGTTLIRVLLSPEEVAVIRETGWLERVKTL